jgi:hypothetical protein
MQGDQHGDQEVNEVLSEPRMNGGVNVYQNCQKQEFLQSLHGCIHGAFE